MAKLTGVYLSKVLGINAEQALYREDGTWYHNLTKFPGVLFDSEGFVYFEKQDDYINHPQLRITKQLHLKNGIKSLGEYRKFDSNQAELHTYSSYHFDNEEFNNEKTVRITRKVNRVLRKAHLVRKIKNLYNNTCQVCGTQLALKNGDYYSEVHHIIPLGLPYSGPDKLSNMICVCPNHHALLDFKSIPLDTSILMLTKHQLSQASLAHHNKLYRDYGIRDNQK